MQMRRIWLVLLVLLVAVGVTAGAACLCAQRQAVEAASLPKADEEGHGSSMRAGTWQRGVLTIDLAKKR